MSSAIWATVSMATWIIEYFVCSPLRRQANIAAITDPTPITIALHPAIGLFARRSLRSEAKTIFGADQFQSLRARGIMSGPMCWTIRCNRHTRNPASGAMTKATAMLTDRSGFTALALSDAASAVANGIANAEVNTRPIFVSRSWTSVSAAQEARTTQPPLSSELSVARHSAYTMAAMRKAVGTSE